MRFGAVPWPDEAYVDEAGQIRVRGVSSQGSPAFARALAEAMTSLDGFGIRPTVYFYFDGPLDPDTLPRGPKDTLEPDASVFLIDADTSSPEAFERIAVEVDYDAAGRRLRLRPAHARALYPGRRYAAVVTRAVKADDGRAVDGAERFVAIRDAQGVLGDPLEHAARDRYAPVLETLARSGLPRVRVAALAVFRVQTVVTDLVDAREQLRRQPAGAAVATEAFSGPQLDTVLGTPLAGTVGLDLAAPHEHIGFMVHGRFESPNLLSMEMGAPGAFSRSAGGELRVQRTDDVPFTVWLPRSLAAGASLPLVVVQHGLERERSDALALANALASTGYAVIAMDAPFHGLRSGKGDQMRRFTEEAKPDGFGDAPGDYAGLTVPESEAEGELATLHPFFYRDALRQEVVDLMRLVYLLQDGDMSALAAADPALSGLTFDGSQIGFVGLGLGADAGVLLSVLEPSLQTLVLAFPGSRTVDGWIQSPAREPLVAALYERFGLEPPAAEVEPNVFLLQPDVDLWRALADRADVLAYAPTLRRMPVNALLLMASEDEVVHGAGTESLANALGAVLVGGEPQYVEQLASEELRPGATLSGNFAVEGGAVTRVLYLLDPATHDTLTRTRGRVEYPHPLEAPFRPLDAPRDVDNPIAESLMQVVFFFESHRACRAMSPTELCAASALAPVSEEP